MGTTNDLPKTAIEAFNAFLKNFVQRKSYVLSTEQSDLFSEKSLKATYNEYCSNSKDDNGEDRKFDDVIKAMGGSDEVSLETMIDIINHAIWLWALPNDKKAPWVYNGPQKIKPYYKEELRSIKGVAGGGRGYVRYKTNGVRFVLFFFIEMCGRQPKDDIIEACSKDYLRQGYPVPDGVKNLLLHLCDPKNYEPIAATSDKRKIVSAFLDCLNPKPTKKDAIQNLDSCVIKIKAVLSGGKGDFSFYSNSLPLLWKGESDNDLSLVQQLEYKKAMILYGPPGTSKTYTAEELAVEVIFRDLMRKNKNVAVELLKKGDIKDALKKRIKKLQFHINYNYEDFIAGQTIDNGSVVTRKGFIYDIVEQSKNKFNISINDEEKQIDNIPFVVILDEINRTDISRVFGELFSAIEKRGEDVDLTLPDPDNTDNKLKLNIPKNIYFIGTMNEIDFSLERIDFALRRRFIWKLHDFNVETLKEIIDYRLDKAVEKKAISDYNDLDIGDIESFCESCTDINKEVGDAMGEAYHIGHAFFAEIADIYIKLKSDGINEAWKKAKEILWQISIKPTLEAYCGSMEKGDKEQYLKKDGGKFNKAFFPL